jgi:hypothetical protein
MLLFIGVSSLLPAAIRKATAASVVSVNPPSTIKIQSLGIDAKIEQVGLTIAGAIRSPRNPGNAAWYTQSSTPGSIGNSIIVGHYGWGENRAAIFDTLHLIQKDASIFITDQEGVLHKFIVRDIRTFNASSETEMIFSSTDKKAHLNLITCTGNWDKELQQYPDRLVVFAELE